jgi:hypothetical protein
MAARVTLKAINDELNRRGHNARLEKASGYFYFFGGESTDWIDRTVPGATVNSRTLEQWIAEFKRLKKVNAELMKSGRGSVGDWRRRRDEYSARDIRKRRTNVTNGAPMRGRAWTPEEESKGFRDDKVRS